MTATDPVTTTDSGLICAYRGGGDHPLQPCGWAEVASGAARAASWSASPPAAASARPRTV